MLRKYEESSLPHIFSITYMIMNKYYPGEPFNIHIQSLINIMQEKIGQLPPKKGKGKLTLFCGNGETFIPVYVLG